MVDHERDGGNAGDDAPKMADNDGGEQQEPENLVTPVEETTPEEKVVLLERALAEVQDTLLRVQAAAQNRVRRAEGDAERAKKFAVQKFAVNLLDLADNFDRALQALPENADECIRTGIESMKFALTAAFNKHGIFEIESAGQKFDPKLHEALVQVPSEELEPGTVAEVIQKGYRIHDRLLRPARVAVVAAAPS